jgi:hypothetical protein
VGETGIDDISEREKKQISGVHLTRRIRGKASINL